MNAQAQALRLRRRAAFMQHMQIFRDGGAADRFVGAVAPVRSTRPGVCSMGRAQLADLGRRQQAVITVAKKDVLKVRAADQLFQNGGCRRTRAIARARVAPQAGLALRCKGVVMRDRVEQMVIRAILPLVIGRVEIEHVAGKLADQRVRILIIDGVLGDCLLQRWRTKEERHESGGFEMLQEGRVQTRRVGDTVGRFQQGRQ